MKRLFSSRLSTVLIILFCMVAAVLTSHFLLTGNSLRLDESQSLWQTSHSLRGTLEVVAKDVHVPLYHVILHLWQVYVSDSVAGARTLSLIFFVLTIPVMYLLAREILARKWALLAVFIFSFSPFMNWYANEARMYTLLVLMATLSQFFFTRLAKGKSGWIGYSITAVFGIYSHYFFWFNLAAQGIFFLFNYKKFAKHSFKKFIALAITLLVAFSPWFLYFRSLGSASGTRPQLASPSTIDLFNSFSQFAFGFQTNVINTILLSLWPLLVIIAMIGVRYKQRLTPQSGYILTAGIVPVVLAFVISIFVTPFFVSRYMIACVGPLIIFTIWLISQYRRGLATVAAVVLVVVTLSGSFIQYRSAATPVKENYRGIAEYISKESLYEDQVVLSSPFTIYPFEFYYDGKAPVRTLPNWDGRAINGIPAFDEATMPQQVIDQSRNHRYAYLVVSYDQGYQETIRQYYANNYELITQRQFSNDVMLYVYRVGYNTAPDLADIADRDKVQP